MVHLGRVVTPLGEGITGAHFFPEAIWVPLLHHYYALGFSLCVEISLLFHSLTNTWFLTEFSCCLGRSFFVSEAYELCHTCYMKSIEVSKPFPFISLKNVRLRLKQWMLVTAACGSCKQVAKQDQFPKWSRMCLWRLVISSGISDHVKVIKKGCY